MPPFSRSSTGGAAPERDGQAGCGRLRPQPAGALGLPAALTVHSERHAYVTHLTEDGVDRRFIQQQVGHECDSSTAVYTHVSDDFMNTALSRALAPAFAGV